MTSRQQAQRANEVLNAQRIRENIAALEYSESCGYCESPDVSIHHHHDSGTTVIVCAECEAQTYLIDDTREVATPDTIARYDAALEGNR